MLANVEFGARRAKGAITIAEDQQHLILSPAINHEIEFLIAVEIGRRDSVRMRITRHGKWRARRKCKSTFAVAEKHGNEFDSVIRDRHVEIAVAIKVSERDIVRVLSSWKGRALCLHESSLSIPEMD